ncbi:MAG: peptidylprolyl isomerase [Deltaproteobacteria bacterium]|jgi:hypothetical protein|nr:peptidylprolyl isomerase [Deltaproteobacteria bacterium]
MVGFMPGRRPWVGLLLLVACQGGEGPAGDKKAAPYPLPSVLPTGEVVAEIGPVKLTTAELDKRLQAQSPFLRVQLRDLDQRKKWVENEVRLETLAQEAWRRGLQDDPRIQAELKRLMVQRLMNDQLDQLSKSLEVTEADVTSAYQARFEEFNKPETIRLSQIIRYASSPADKKAARARLEAARDKILADQKKNLNNTFADLARTESEDEETKNGGGDLQFLNRAQVAERYGDPIAALLFEQTEVGELQVAEAEGAVVLFKKTGKRRGVTRGLPEVVNQLRGQLVAEKRNAAFDDFVNTLQKDRGIRVDYDQIPKLTINLEAPTAGIPAAPAKDGGP